MTHVLVFGANGFVGRSVIPALLSENIPVHAVSRSVSPLPSHPLLHWHRDPESDPERLRELFADCHCAIHLASATTPGTTARHPTMEAKDNISPSLRFIEAIQEFQNIRIVFVSSGGALYGNHSQPVREDFSTKPISYYAAGKLALEAFFEALHNYFGHEVIVLRPSNLYGPSQHFKRSFGLIRSLIEHSLTDQRFEVWGDGETIRDYIYISDFIDSLIKVVKTNYVSSGFSRYNVSSGEGHSINAVISTIQDITGKNLDVDYRPARQSDVKRIVLDSSLFRKQYAWTPTTSLRTGILNTLSWLNAL